MIAPPSTPMQAKRGYLLVSRDDATRARQAKLENPASKKFSSYCISRFCTLRPTIPGKSDTRRTWQEPVTRRSRPGSERGQHYSVLAVVSDSREPASTRCTVSQHLLSRPKLSIDAVSIRTFYLAPNELDKLPVLRVILLKAERNPRQFMAWHHWAPDSMTPSQSTLKS